MVELFGVPPISGNLGDRVRRTFARMLMVVASVFALGLAGVTWQWNKANVNAFNYQEAAALAEKNANEFKAAEALAKQRLKESRQIVNEYFTEVAAPNGPLANLPGAEDLRRSLLVKARDYYVDFVAQSSESDDEETRLEFAQANVRLGVIIHKLDPGSATAQDALNTGVTELRGLIADADEFSIVHQEALADALTEVLRIDVSQNRKASSVAASEEIVAIRKQVDAELDDLDSLLQVGMATSNLALVHNIFGSKQEENEAVTETLLIGAELLVERDDDPKTLLNVSKFNLNAASLSGWREGKWEEAKGQLETAVELVTRELDFGELEEERLQQLSMAYQNIAMVYFQCKDVPASQEAFRRNLECAAELVELKPQFPHYKSQLAASWGNYFTFLARLGKQDEAFVAVNNWARISVELAHSHPDSLAYVKTATYAERIRSNVSPLSDASTAVFLNREKLLRQQLALAPAADNTRSDLVFVLGCQPQLSDEASDEELTELLELSDFVDEKEQPKYNEQLCRALALVRNEQAAEALEILDSIVEEKRLPDWPVIRGLAQAATADWDAAVASLQQADEEIAAYKKPLDPLPYATWVLRAELRKQVHGRD